MPGICPHRIRREVVKTAAMLVVGLLLAVSAVWAEDGDFVVFLVHAVGLDYSDPARLLGQLHKRTSFKNGFMGHSWVYLEGTRAGRREVFDAGITPRIPGGRSYFEGVLNLARYGHAQPSPAQRENPRPDPNPIAYLWRDKGNGQLKPAIEADMLPTYAARVDLTRDQYGRIRPLMDPRLPSHRSFSLTGQQCSSFVARIAELAGVRLDHRVSIGVPQQVRIKGRLLRLWTDPAYAALTISSPDVIELSLRRLVASGRAREVTDWYIDLREEP